MNSLYDKTKKNNLNKKIEQKNSIYPRIISPYIQPKFINKYKESNTMANFNKFHISKISKKTLSSGNRDNKVRYNSNSGIRKFNIMKKNNLARNEITCIDCDENKNLNNISSYKSLKNIWNEFGVVNTYKNFFNMILNKLNDEEKEDLCNKEIKELIELKNNINSLNKEIQSRKNSLKNIKTLNNKLGEIVSDEGNNIDEEIIKDISNEITNLRIYTVNTVYKMKKIKNKIYEGHIYGKFDLEKISEKFGFDINYLIKMKEEMLFLKEGYIKRFFNVNNDYNPFLLKASEKMNNSNGEPNFNIVPISNELRDNIKQCNYYIYQELIYYQNKKIKKNFHKIISPSKSENKIFISKYKGNNLYNKQLERNNNNFIKNKNDEYNNLFVNQREFNIYEKDKNIQDESILFEEKGINIRDILGETPNDKYNKQNINQNINKAKNNVKIFSKNVEKFSESQISKKSEIISNNSNRKFNRSSSCRFSYKNFKVAIFNNYINYFNDNYYKDYYKKIPEQEILMFNLQNNILSPLLNGIAPFLLLVKDENDNIYGVCAFNYIYHKNKLKIKINHISSIADYNYNDYIDNLKIIYGNLINYIIKQFYFDELFVEFSKNQKNEEIYELFVNKFSFVEKTISIKKNQNESNGGDEIENNESNKLSFLLYRNKVQINDSIKDSINSFFGKNIIHFFDSIIVTNKNKTLNLNNKSDKKELNFSDSELFINVMAVNNLFQSKNNSNFSNIYKNISSLEHLIKIFLNNNIDNEEIPLSIAENRFDIVSFVINKNINDILRNSYKLINNYNIYNSSSFLDESTGIYYNLMKPEKIYILSDNKNEMNFYLISNNTYAVFFIQINNKEIKQYILKENVYIQINEILNELLSNKMIDLLENKIIWIPCFNTYKHLKCLINNSFFYVHEYISISNKIINSVQKKKKDENKSYGLLFNKELNSFLIEPQINKDIIIDNDFIIGVINNASYFNKLLNNKNDSSSLIKEKEKIIPSNCSIKSEDEKEKNNEYNKSENLKKNENKKSKDNINTTEFPNIVFLNYISKKDFINNK